MNEDCSNKKINIQHPPKVFTRMGFSFLLFHSVDMEHTTVTFELHLMFVQDYMLVG
jgi:hypothetical protein